MLHSQIVNTHSRTRDDWIKRFWISGKSEDYEKVCDAVDHILHLGEVTKKDKFPNSLDVTEILHGLQVDQETLLASLLSDYRFIDHTKLENILETIENGYGKSIRNMVNGVYQLHTFVNCRIENQMNAPEQSESLRRMLLTMATDVRAVLIKLAWRLQHLRILKDYDDEYRVWIAKDSLDIFAPLANRLGVNQLKWEIEDLSFRYIDPVNYKKVAKALQDRRVERETFIDTFVSSIKSLLKAHNIEAEVYGRPKHIYSIWKKMQRKGVGIDQLYDLRAVRITVDAHTETCYYILWLIHNKWHYKKEEFDDYITNRKPNGYQSIHTVIVGPKGKYVEVQIRTRKMHMVAEYGVAAHWRYKEGGSQDKAMERAIASLRYLLDNKDNGSQLMEDFHTEVFSDRVFVLTPKGKVIELPKCSTPLDFAYAVHTSIGHRCRGALINGVMGTLNYVLQNGDQVEILTGTEEHPKRDWLNKSLGYVCSPRTRSKIRHWFRQQDHEENYREGKSLFHQEQHRLGISKITAEDLAKHFKKQNERDFLIALGRGDISVNQLIDAMIVPSDDEFAEIPLRELPADDNTRGYGIIVNGEKDLLTQLSTCCKPVAGDAITGYITVGRGITIHRQDCTNILNMTDEQKKRLVDVEWDSNRSVYAADITVIGYNLPGLLRNIADVTTKRQINLVEVISKPGNEPNTSVIKMTIQIEDKHQLAEVLDRIAQLPNVIDAKRSG